jgi:hypothetical protein
MVGGNWNLSRFLAATVAAYALLLAGMIRWHWSQGPPYTQETPALLAAFGLSAALAGLLTIWGALTALHWTKRASGFIVGTAVLGGFWLLFSEWNRFLIWQLLVMFAVEIGVLILVLAIARIWGYAFVRTRAGSSDVVIPRDHASSNFSIRDLLLLTAAFAFFFAVLRCARPIDLETKMDFILALGGSCAALISLLTLWGCFGTSHILLRASTLILVAPIGGAAYIVASHYARLPLLFSWPWYAGVTALQTLLMTIPLGLIHSHGYGVVTKLEKPI